MKAPVAPLAAAGLALLSAPALAQEQATTERQDEQTLLTMISIEDAAAAIRESMPDAIITEAELDQGDSGWLWNEPEVTDWVWELQAFSPDRTEYEITVSAVTGEVLNVDEK